MARGLFTVNHRYCDWVRGVLVVGAWVASSVAGAGVYTPIFIAIPGERAKPDEICVGSGAAVGEAEVSVNGDRLVIRKLLGSSQFCRDPGAPVLAQADLVESEQFKSGLTITVPRGFEALPLTTKDRFDGTRFKGTDGPTEYLVQSYARKVIPDLDQYQELNRTKQSRWLHASQTPVEELTIDGAPARRWETTTRTDALGARSRTHMTTIIYGAKEVAYIDVLVTSFKLPAQRALLNGVGESVRGLSGAAQSPVTTPDGQARSDAGEPAKQ